MFLYFTVSSLISTTLQIKINLSTLPRQTANNGGTNAPLMAQGLFARGRFMIYRNCDKKSNSVQCARGSVCVCEMREIVSFDIQCFVGSLAELQLVTLSALVLTHRLTFVSTHCYLAQHSAHGQRGQ